MTNGALHNDPIMKIVNTKHAIYDRQTKAIITTLIRLYRYF